MEYQLSQSMSNKGFFTTLYAKKINKVEVVPDVPLYARVSTEMRQAPLQMWFEAEEEFTIYYSTSV